jgi:hypothetical protein
MNETKAVLEEIAHQLKVLTVTVAALEAFTGARATGHKYADARALLEQANQSTFDRLNALIDAIPDKD